MLMCFCEEPMTLEMGKGNIFATRCGHMFHDSCLALWIEKSETCPQCRSQVTEQDMIRLYPALCGEDAYEDLNDVLQSCLESLEDTKYQLEHMTAVCKENERIIKEKDKYAKEKDKYAKEKDKIIEEKDKIIANLKIDLEKVKTLGQTSEALESLVQMLDGLKGMATIICKTADKSTQQDVVAQLRTEASDADAVISQTNSETSNGDVSVIPTRAERSHALISVTQPEAGTSCTSNAHFSVTQSEAGTSCTSNAHISLTQPEAETTNVDAVVTEPESETPSADVSTQPRAETYNTDADESLEADVVQNDTTIESSDVYSELDLTRTESNSESLGGAEDDVIESRSEASNETTMSQPRTESMSSNAEDTEPEESPTMTQTRSELYDVMTQSHTVCDDNENVIIHNNNIMGSKVVTETAAIKSSINTLEHMLIRISEIKNSTRYI